MRGKALSQPYRLQAASSDLARDLSAGGHVATCRDGPAVHTASQFHTQSHRRCHIGSQQPRSPFQRHGHGDAAQNLLRSIRLEVRIVFAQQIVVNKPSGLLVDVHSCFDCICREGLRDVRCHCKLPQTPTQ